MNNAMKRTPALLLIIAAPLLACAQLVVTNTQTPAQLVQNTLLGGLVATNIIFNGAPATAVITQVGAFNSANSNVGIASGLILSTGNVASAIGPNNGAFANTILPNNTTDPDLVLLANGQNIGDAAVLRFNFIPTGNTVSFRFVFASEEYPLYVCGGFNDAFGFFLSGPGINGPYQNNAVNLALIPGTTTPVTINTVNSGTAGNQGAAANCAALDPNWQANAQFFVNNMDNNNPDPTAVRYNGLTTVMTATAQVQCGQVYSIKIAIGDAGDDEYDSAIFLEAGSFSSPSMAVDATAALPSVACLGDPGLGAAITTPGQAPYTWAWSSGGAAAGSTQQPAHSASATAWYTVQVTDACGRSATDSVLVTVQPPTIAPIDDLVLGCDNMQATVPQVAGTGPFAWQWTADGQAMGGQSQLVIVPGDAPAAWTVSATDACGATTTETFMVTPVPVQPIAFSLPPDTLLTCGNSTVLGATGLTGGTAPQAFAWTNDGVPAGNSDTVLATSADPGLFTCTVTDACGQSAQQSVNVSAVQYDPFVLTLPADTLLICPGNGLVLNATATGGAGGYLFAWTDDNGSLLAQTAAAAIATDSSAVYNCTVTDDCGNTLADQVSVAVPVLDTLRVDPGPDLTLCVGTGTELIAAVTGGAAPYTIVWSGGATGPVLELAPEASTNVSVSVADQCGNIAGGQVAVGVENPTLSIAATSEGPDEWAFSAMSFPPAASYNWDFGDGYGSAAAAPEHGYTDFQDHTAALTITTANGCIAIDTVRLNAEAHVHFPNAFTPNGDGINDVFTATGNAIGRIAFQVFDRRGAQVFSAEGPGQAWDGRSATGEPAPTGVYVVRYVVEGERLPTTEGLTHVTLL